MSSSYIYLQNIKIVLIKFDVYVDHFRSSLHANCYEGNEVYVASALETKVVDIDEPDISGHRTPLHYACLAGRLNIVVKLVQAGASVGVPKQWKGKACFPAIFYAGMNYVGDVISIIFFISRRKTRTQQTQISL